jgi:hypothetical protein
MFFVTIQLGMLVAAAVFAGHTAWCQLASYGSYAATDAATSVAIR